MHLIEEAEAFMNILKSYELSVARKNNKNKINNNNNNFRINPAAPSNNNPPESAAISFSGDSVHRMQFPLTIKQRRGAAATLRQKSSANDGPMSSQIIHELPDTFNADIIISDFEENDESDIKNNNNNNHNDSNNNNNHYGPSY